MSLFWNITILFFIPRKMHELVSDVIGTSIKCGSSTCDTDHLNLSSTVTITFEHSQELIVS